MKASHISDRFHRKCNLYYSTKAKTTLVRTEPTTMLTAGIDTSQLSSPWCC